MSLSSSSEESFDSMTLQGQMNATKSRWLAHGIMAFLAFGVFAPLAITTAILRDCYVPARRKNFMSKFTNRWLYVDVVLNTLTYFFTLVIFSVAVSTINIECWMLLLCYGYYGMLMLRYSTVLLLGRNATASECYCPLLSNVRLASSMLLQFTS